MRLFVAIPVPEEIKQYAYAIRNELEFLNPDIKWVEYQNYHLTLKFLGEVEDYKIDRVQKCLMQAAESSTPFVLRLSHLGFFPNRRHPRVLWIGVKGELDKADFLGERIDAYLNELGFEDDKKRTFHLTLGRIRSERNQNKLIEKIYEINQNITEYKFAVNNFLLMESYLYSDGPVYKVNHSFELKG